MPVLMNKKLLTNSFSLTIVLTLLAMLVVLSFPAKMTLADAPNATMTLANTTLTLGVSPVVTGTGFADTEQVALWLTAPDQTVRFYGEGKTDSAGTLVNYFYQPNPSAYKGYSQAQLATLQTNLPGRWSITAQGLTSGAVGTATFKVLTPTLRATITNKSGNIYSIKLGGTFFYNFEPVGLWLTDTSTLIVIPLLTMPTNSIGVFPATGDGTPSSDITLTFQTNGTTGPYVLTAYGIYSTQQVVINVGSD